MKKDIKRISFLIVLIILSVQLVGFAEEKTNRSYIYYFDQNGQLIEDRLIKWDELNTLIDEILKGPEQKELWSPLSSSTDLISSSTEDNILSLNFNSELSKDITKAKYVVEFLEKNLSNITTIDGFKLTINGKNIGIVDDINFDSVFYFETYFKENTLEVSPMEVIAPDLHLVIDPGHGGDNNGTGIIDCGAYNWEVPDSVYEKDMVLSIANELKDYATGNAKSIFLTRTGDDYDLTYEERINRINNSGGNLLISLHHNSQAVKDPDTGEWVQGHTAKGISTYYYDDIDKFVAEKVHSEAKNAYFGTILNKFDDLGIKYGNFYVLRDTNVDGCLIELGYISNTDHDYLIISDDSHHSQMAYRIWLGIRKLWWGY